MTCEFTKPHNCTTAPSRKLTNLFLQRVVHVLAAGTEKRAPRCIHATTGRNRGFSTTREVAPAVAAGALDRGLASAICHGLAAAVAEGAAK